MIHKKKNERKAYYPAVGKVGIMIETKCLKAMINFYLKKYT